MSQENVEVVREFFRAWEGGKAWRRGGVLTIQRLAGRVGSEGRRIGDIHLGGLMRKLMVTGVIAALGIALLATPASASFDHHFRVFEKVSFNPNANETAFRFRGTLFDPRNRHDRVGRDRGLCRIRPHETLKCRGTYHLNGEIGGFGDIKVRGNLRPGDNRLSVVGGSGDFNGVGGKLVYRYLNQRGTKSMDKFDLVR